MLSCGIRFKSLVMNALDAVWEIPGTFGTRYWAMIALPGPKLGVSEATSATVSGPCRLVLAGPRLEIRIDGEMVSPGCITLGTLKPEVTSSGNGAWMSALDGLLTLFPRSVSGKF